MSRNLARVGTVAIFFLFAACSGEVALPTAQATAQQMIVNTGNVVRLDGSASKDPQGRTLFFEWSFVTIPQGSAATLRDAAQMLPSFLADVAGNYVIQLVVSNGVVKSPPVTITIQVTLCGFSPPVVTVAQGTFNNVNPQTAVQLSANATDPDNACLIGPQQTVSVTWSVVSRPPGSSAIILAPASASTSFTPDVAGAYQLQAVATDSTGLKSVPAFVNVTANTCGSVAPIITALAPIGGTLFTQQTLPKPIVTDANCLANGSQSLRWSISAAPAGSVAFLSDPSADQPSFTPDKVGDYQFTVVAKNSLGIQSAPATLTLSVATCGNAPLTGVSVGISAIVDPDSGAVPLPAVPNVGARLTLSAAFTDPNVACGATNLLPFAYSWSFIQKPFGSAAQFDSATAATPSFVPDKQGSYQISVSARDVLGNGSSAQVLSFNTSSCGANAPTTDFTVAAGTGAFDPYTLTAGSVTNADDNSGSCPARFAQGPYTFAWSVVSPPSANFSLSSSFGSPVRFTPRENATYTVRLTATGAKGATATVTKDIAVNCALPGFDVNAPAISAVAPPAGDTFSRGGPGAFSVFAGDRVTVTASATGRCRVDSADQFTYKWTLLSRPANSNASLNSDTLAQPTFVADVPGGVYTLQANVTDALGNATSSAILTVTASTCGSNPIFASVSNATPGAAPFDPRLLLAVPTAPRPLFSDDDDATVCPSRFRQTYAFSWSSPGLPAGTFATPASQATTFAPGGSTLYGVQAKVSGSNGRSAVAVIGVDARCLAPLVSASAIAPSFAVSDPTLPRSTARVFRDDSVIVSTVGASACFSPANAGLTYQWMLTRGGSAATINGATSPAANFTVDLPSTSYTATVVVRDALGNASAPQSLTFNAANCGANPILADFSVGQAPGARAFDDYTLATTFVPGRTTFSDDDDPTQCPSNLRVGRYTQEWSSPSAAPDVGSVFDSTQGNVVHFTPGGNAVFSVKLHFSAPGGRSTDVVKQIAVSCSDVTPSAGSVSVTGSTPGYTTKIFRDDIATLSAHPSSLCFSDGGTPYSFRWTLTPPLGSISQLSSLIAPNPTFSVDKPAVVYGGTVIAVDKLGNRSNPTTFAFTSETCGINPVAVTFPAPTQTSGTLPFDGWSANSIGTSDDEDPTKCPARFHQSYPIAWQVTASPGGATKFAISPTAGNSTTFTKGEAAAGTYTLKATATASASGLTGFATRDIATAPCASPGPTFGSSSIAIAQVNPAAPDGYYGSHPGSFFNGDGVTVSAPTTFDCYTSQAQAGAAYAWSLTTGTPPAPGIAPVNTDQTRATFTANAANRAFHVRADVTDHWGNTGFAAHDFTSGACGTNSFSAAIGVNATGKPRDVNHLTLQPGTGAFFSDDDDSTKCPARFAHVYDSSFTVTSAAPPAFSLPKTGALTADFTAQADFNYAIRGDLKVGSTTVTSATTSIDGTCSAPNAPAPSIVSVNGVGVTSTPTIFAGDSVGVSATLADSDSFCFAHPVFVYSWRVNRDGTSANGEFVPPFPAPSPTASASLTPQGVNATYAVFYAVRDGAKQNLSTTTTFTTPNCGATVPVVTLQNAAQSFGAIVRSFNGGADETAPLTINYPNPEDGGAPAADAGVTIPVPFYLDTNITMTVKVDDPGGAACGSYQITNAALTRPTDSDAGIIGFTSTGVDAGNTVTFTFNPDRGSDGGVAPAQYGVQLTVATPAHQFAVANSPTVPVEGNCGLNAPVADFTIDGGSTGHLAGETLQLDGGSSSDKDNAVLMVPTDGGPVSGCGLNQALTYTWATTEPDGGSVIFTPNGTTNPGQSLTVGTAGDYTIDLTVDDGKLTGTKTETITVLP